MASYKIMLALFVLGVAYAAGQMVGAPREMLRDEIDNDKVLHAAVDFAVAEYNSKTDSRYIARIIGN